MGSKNLFGENFKDEGGRYFWIAHDFALAADSLEKIAHDADKIWSAEFEKLNIQPGGEFKKNESDEGVAEMQMASNYRRFHGISVYLFAHSVELSLKGLYIKKTGELIYTHKISELYRKTKEHIDQFVFNASDLDDLFLKLDELLIWAGRYPDPKKNDCEARKKLGEINFRWAFDGHIPDVVTAINSVANGNGIKLMQNFLKYILESFSALA